MELQRREAIELALEAFGGNPIQLQILVACADAQRSAKDLALTKAELGSVAYHFRVLADRKMIRYTRSEQRRGAVQKFYVTTPAGRRLLARLGVGEDGHDQPRGASV